MTSELTKDSFEISARKNLNKRLFQHFLRKTDKNAEHAKEDRDAYTEKHYSMRYSEMKLPVLNRLVMFLEKNDGLGSYDILKAYPSAEQEALLEFLCIKCGIWYAPWSTQKMHFENGKVITGTQLRDWMWAKFHASKNTNHRPWLKPYYVWMHSTWVNRKLWQFLFEGGYRLENNYKRVDESKFYKQNMNTYEAHYLINRLKMMAENLMPPAYEPGEIGDFETRKN